MTIDAGVGRIPTWTRADRLRKARESSGLDQTALGQRIGVSRGTISNAERGTVEPRRAVIMAWAMATGVPLSWIDTGEAPSPGGDGASGGLPQLDSNQQPFGYRSAQVTGLLRPIVAADAA